MIRSSLLLSLLFSLLYSQELVSRTKVMMGTFITLSVTSDKQDVLQKGFNVLKKVDNALSSFKNSSDIYRLNQTKSQKLSPFSYQALMLSKKYYKQSNGYFDITIGSLTKDVYQFGNESINEINTTLQQESYININALHVNNTYASLDKGIKVDLGGMGKGFGVDKVYEVFKKAGVNKGVIQLSGDIKCISTCSISITNPFKPDTVFATFYTKKKLIAISTSGNYRRYIKTKKQNHLLNPYTKTSQQVFASITLISKGSNSELDAMATAIMVMPKKEALAFLQAKKYHYILIDNNKKLYISKNLERVVDITY